jgi:arginyl-tRNA synthetase
MYIITFINILSILYSMIKEVTKLLKKSLKEMGIKLENEKIESLIEIPPSAEMGDYAFPCFSFAEQLKRNPHEIAIELRQKMGTESATDFDDIQTKGPYLNFFLDRKNMARKVIWDAITFKEKYGRGEIGKKKKVIVEFSSPNIAKPFGIGHLRSTIIGNSIANLHEFQGYKTIKMNYFGDWGTQFGRLIYGYRKYGNDAKLSKNPVKHLLDIYVKSNKNKKDEEGARKEFKNMEEGDKGALILWKLFKQFGLADFKVMYKRLGIDFDAQIGESDYNKKMPEIIKELEKKKLLVTSQGAKVVDLKKDNLGVCLIKKTDGGTLYATRDITSAITRHKKYKFDKMIYEVGQEQKLYFKQFLKVLELMGYDWAKNCVHVSHGHYLDTDGKRFATRKGKTVIMEEVLDKTIALAKKEIKKREPKLRKTELETRASKIAIAAIFYGDLKNNRSNNVIFDLKKFVSFEGDTGPYIQYSYARATSILKKAKASGKFEVPDLEKKELDLVKKLSMFSDVAFKAYESMNPSMIANYAFQLAKLFNEFYHVCPVIGSEQEAFRLALTEAFRQILKNALKLLGIETLEKM